MRELIGKYKIVGGKILRTFSYPIVSFLFLLLPPLLRHLLPPHPLSFFTFSSALTSSALSFSSSSTYFFSFSTFSSLPLLDEGLSVRGSVRISVSI